MGKSTMRGLTRRRFLAAGPAGVAAHAFLMLSARAKGANARIRAGVIGCGRMGMAHIGFLREAGMGENVEVVAVCDLLPPRRERARGEFKISAYGDWRDLIASGRVDAVLVATPDHWHAPMSIAALRQGLDVYCETPMALTHEESREMLQAAKETKRVVQIGARPVLSWPWRAVRAVLSEGNLEKPWRCQIICGGDWSSGSREEEEVTSAQWLGFSGARSGEAATSRRFYHWQNYGAYSLGLAAARQYENLAGILSAVSADFPARVSAAGGRVGESEGDTADVLMTSLEYAPDFHVRLVSPCPKLRRSSWIRSARAALVFQENQVALERASGEVKRVAPQANRSMLEDWLLCLRTGRPVACGPELGHQAQVAVLMAARACREARTFRYDPDTAAISPCAARA